MMSARAFGALASFTPLHRVWTTASRDSTSKLVLAGTLLLMAVTGRSGAQAPPAWTADLAAGVGSRTHHTGGATYYGNESGVWLFRGSIRVGPERRMAPYVQVEADDDFGNGMMVCAGTGNSPPCPRNFPTRRGVAGGLGLRYLLARRLIVGSSIGRGSYNGGARTFVEGDLAAVLSTHLALRAASRYQWWTMDSRDYWFAPITVGMQLSWPPAKPRS